MVSKNYVSLAFTTTKSASKMEHTKLFMLFFVIGV